MNRLVSVDVTLKLDNAGDPIQTEKAWLVEYAGSGGKLEELWVPKSLGVYDIDAETMEVPEWFATKEGLV